MEIIAVEKLEKVQPTRISESEVGKKLVLLSVNDPLIIG